MQLRTLAPVLVVVLLACKKDPASETAAIASPSDIASARAKTEELEKARKAALGSARGTIVPRPDLGKCPVAIPEFGPPRFGNKDLTGSKQAWGGFDVSRYEPGREDDFLANFPDELASIERLGIAYADEVTQKPGPRGFRMHSLAGDKSPSRWQVEALLKTEDAFDFELVIDDEIAPEMVGNDKFVAGTIRARFYVWDVDKRAIVCAARALAQSSDRLHASGRDQGAVDHLMKSGLLSDLREQALIEAATRTYVAGPPRDDGERDAGRADAAAHEKDGGAKGQ